MTFANRLTAVVFSAVLATVIAVAAGAYLAGEQVNEDIERARVSHLVGTLRATTEANLSIGLGLDQIGQLQNRIEREKANDPEVLAIDIFNAQGRSLYSTDLSAVGEKVADGWTRHLSRDGLWQDMTGADTIFGTRFENDLGVAGGIAITVSDQTRNRRAEALGLDLAARTLALGIGAALLAALAALAFAHLLTRPFEKVARILRGEPPPATTPGSLEHLATQARRSWGRAETQVDRGLSQLGALDDAG